MLFQVFMESPSGLGLALLGSATATLISIAIDGTGPRRTLKGLAEAVGSARAAS